jgi:hypothetical protein
LHQRLMSVTGRRGKLRITALSTAAHSLDPRHLGTRHIQCLANETFSGMDGD